MDRLMGFLAFASHIHDLTVPPSTLGADNSYLAFSISTTTPATKRGPPAPTSVQIHFNHALDAIYMSHLSCELPAFIGDDADLAHVSNSQVSVVQDATTRSFPTTRSTTHPLVGKMPHNP